MISNVWKLSMKLKVSMNGRMQKKQQLSAEKADFTGAAHVND